MTYQDLLEELHRLDDSQLRNEVIAIVDGDKYPIVEFNDVDSSDICLVVE